MQSQCAPELLVVSATASSEPAAYAHALRQLLGGVLGGIAASGAPHGGLRLAVASWRSSEGGLPACFLNVALVVCFIDPALGASARLCLRMCHVSACVRGRPSVVDLGGRTLVCLEFQISALTGR